MKQQFTNNARLAGKKTNYVRIAASVSLLLCVIAYAECEKSYTQARPDYIVNGIHDISMVNNSLPTGSPTSLTLSISYDAQSYAAQEEVSLSLSGLPAGITMDTTWITKGYPTFTTTLNLYDTSAVGVTPGTYTITLTTTGSSTGKKTFPFTLKVSNMPSCTAALVGYYGDCYSSCVGSYYTDSLYNDPVTPNKVWFSNFFHTGHAVYAVLNCNNMQLTIPSQSINGVIYSASYLSVYNHSIYGNIVTGVSSCYLNMR